MTALGRAVLRFIAPLALLAVAAGSPAWAQPAPAEPVPPQPAQPPSAPPPPAGPEQPAPTPPAPSPPAPSGQAPPGSPAPPAGAAPPVTPGPPALPPTYVATSDAVAFFYYVRRERTKDFEEVLLKVKAGLAAAPSAALRGQATGWSLFKASEAGPSNTVLYVVVVDPAVAQADYSLSHVLAAVAPLEIDTLWARLRDAATSATKLSLSRLVTPPGGR